jgi:hypothetical protein
MAIKNIQACTLCNNVNSIQAFVSPKFWNLENIFFFIELDFWDVTGVKTNKLLA